MAIEKIYLDPNAQSYADLADLDSTAATKLAGIEESADANVGEEFSTAEQTKLTGIDAGAEVNPADLAALDAAANTKLTGIEESATADQTGAEIKTAYEAEANAYTDTKDTKLTGVEAEATADQTGAEVRDAIVGLADDDREIIISRPQTGQKRIYAVQTHTDGKQEIEQSDTAES